jgi:hypothetical protein
MTNKIVLWHPLLFSIIFVIMPFTQFAGLIPPGQIAVPFIVICAFVLLSYFIIKRIVKRTGLAVAVLSPLLIIFCNYGSLYEYISELTRGTQHKFLVLVLATLVILIVLIVYNWKVLSLRERAINIVNKAFCVIAGALIMFNAFSIIAQSIGTAKIIKSSGTLDVSMPKNARTHPDIYFVILDEYAAPSQMKNYFQYDMSPFVEYLTRRGFMITEMSTDSLATAAILDGRLNMEAKKRQSGTLSSGSLSGSLLESTNIVNAQDEEQMIRLRNGKVITYLKSIGYQFINMGSWFTQTRDNQLADQNVNCFGFQLTDELSTIILHNSVLRLILINRYFHRQAVLDAFANLENMPVSSGKPKFIFAHIICPHSPYVFGANGEKLGLKPGENKDAKQLYLDQHIFISKKVKEFVDKKLSASQPTPVIIIQGDHGARMDRPNAHQVFNAVYIPDYKGKSWQDSISSVNTFRVLFNDIFGTNMEILK